jgi:transcriptional regulator with XRE-family HTH domain
MQGENTIGEAIRQAAEAAGWSAARVAAEAGTAENAARNWMYFGREPRGPSLERLRRRLPGLAEILDKREDAA